MTHKDKPAGRIFDTARDAVAELERRHGPRSALWTYHDASGEPVGVVVRWDLADGKKDIRPASRHGDGWRIGGMPEPRPLYGLPDLAGAKRVYVCEGEKAADAVRSVGLAATTSAHGCESPGKAEWRPLADKEVILLPDNDPPGRKYADAVAALLAKLTPAPVVKLVELPDLPDHGDAVDFVAARLGIDADELRRIVEALADEAEPMQARWPAASGGTLRTVPRRCVAPTRARFRGGRRKGHWLRCVLRGDAANDRVVVGDREHPADSIETRLDRAGDSVGCNRRRKWHGQDAGISGWHCGQFENGNAMPWNATRKRCGTTKLTWPVTKRRWPIWKRDEKTTDEPPAKPEAPQAERCIVSDTTVEALAPLLLANPRGLLMARDELAGWIGSFDRYAGGKGGADAAHWLSMHAGESIVVDRKTGIPRTIFVPQAAVCVCGGIQPAILHRALGIEHRESGLAARLLLTCPPRVAKRWTEAEIDPAAEAEIARLVDRLYELQPIDSDEGEMRPVVVGLIARRQGGLEIVLQRPRPRASRPGRRAVGRMVEARGIRGEVCAGDSLRPLGSRRFDTGERRRCRRGQHGGRHPACDVVQGGSPASVRAAGRNQR